MPPSELELRRLERRVAALEAELDERVADVALKLRRELERTLGRAIAEQDQRIDRVHARALRELTRLHEEKSRR